MSIMYSMEEWAVFENGIKISTTVPKFIDDWAANIMGYPGYHLREAIIRLYKEYNGREKYEEELKKEFKELMIESYWNHLLHFPQ